MSASAFTQVVSDPQFAALGLVLLSTLSKVKAGLGKQQDEASLPSPTPKLTSLDAIGAPSEDLGERVMRDEAEVQVQSIETADTTPSDPHPKTTDNQDDTLRAPVLPKVQNRTRRKRKNPIDELFAKLN